MSKKLKLMQITHDLAIGGLQQVVVNICRTIDRSQFDVVVLCLRELGEFAPEVEKMGIKVILLPQKENGVDYFSFLKVLKILKNEKIDIVHTHNTQPFIDGAMAGFFAGVKTLVHTDHARNFPDKRRYMIAEWVMSHFAYKLVGVSEHTSSNLVKYENISRKKIITIPNGIDETRYNIEIDVNMKKQEIGIKNTGPVIGLGVRLEKQKGITYLLQAMPEIIKKIPNVNLIIAGSGYLEGELTTQAEALGVNKNIFFIGPRLDLPEILKLMDLYVLPSLWEGLPMVILEAMAAGCPIVATDVGGNSTVIKNGENGMLVSAENSEEIAAGVIYLLGNEGLRERYISLGMNLIRDSYSARVMTQRYQQLYLREV